MPPNPSRPLFDPRDQQWGALLGAGGFALYLAPLSRAYVFGGLARAMPIEAGIFRGLFNGNFLLYGLAGWCFHNLLGLFGARPLAVVSLQIMDAALGGAGLWLFFHCARRLGAGRPAAALWTIFLGLSLGYWSWSTDAQDYIFSTFLLEAHFLALLLRADGRKVPAWVLGLIHGLCVLGHIVNVLAGLVGLWFLLGEKGAGRRRAVLEYVGASVALVGFSYALALGLAVRPADAGAAWRWWLGSLQHRESALWAHSLRGLWRWARMTLNILVSLVRSLVSFWSGACLSAARVLAVLLGLRFLAVLRDLKGARRAAAGACGLWLVVYAAVFSSWQPDTMVYRVSDLVPLVVLLMLGVEGGPGAGTWRAAAALCAVLMGAGNYDAEIQPRTVLANNERLSRMEFIRDKTPEAAWVTAAEADAGGDELYIPYFAGRRAILLSGARERLPDLAARLDSLLAAGQPVYTSSRVLDDPFWAAFFRSLEPRLEADDGRGFRLYRLKGLPPARARRGGRR
jgi:hypothetical protein